MGRSILNSLDDTYTPPGYNSIFMYVNEPDSDYFVAWNSDLPLAVACRNGFSEIAHLLVNSFEISSRDVDRLVNARYAPFPMWCVSDMLQSVRVL